MSSKVSLVFLTIVGITIANGVLDLTDDDFASRIADIDASLVMFYDPWCTYCAEIKQDFDKASELTRRTNQPFILARVNCWDGGKETCLEHSIEVDDYPIMKIFRRGKLSTDYAGPDDAAVSALKIQSAKGQTNAALKSWTNAELGDGVSPIDTALLTFQAGIAKFMQTRYGVASTELFTVAETEEFLKVQEPTLIAFFEKGNDIETFFLKYAEHFTGDYNFGHSSAPEVLSKYNEKNSIVFYRAPHFHNKFEPSSFAFKGETQEELTKFLKKNRHGLVGHRKPDNIQDFDHPNVIAYYTVDYVTNAKNTNYWRNRILQVAKDNSDYKFAVSAGDDFRLELEKFGQPYLGEKPLVTAHDKDGRPFKLTTEFSVENVKQFVSDLKQGKLEPFIRSQPIPRTNDEPVKIVVAKNFDEIVINNGKDTFLEIYAPWCGYCKELAPIFDELGTKMIDEDVEIVKFDGSNNEVPASFQLQGFPSLYWLPKDSKHKPIMYSEGKDLQNFIEYIAKHASSELKNYDRNGEIKKSEL